MLKKTIFTLSLLCLAQTSFAENCPTPAALSAGSFQGWQALDIDNGEPLSSIRLARFKKQVVYFAMAEWMLDAPEGEAHCYYFGKSRDIDYLGVFLAKQNLVADKSTAWQNVSGDYVMQCQESIEACGFVARPNVRTHQSAPTLG
jgi:hypothetical protein